MFRFITSIKGRLIGLVAFFLLVLLGFSLFMLYQSNQTKESFTQVLEVRTSINNTALEIRGITNMILSEARRSILKQTNLSAEKDMKRLRHEVDRLDSLQIYFGDSAGTMLKELRQGLEDYNSSFIRGDSTWRAFLNSKQKAEVRLREIDAHITSFRRIEAHEKSLGLASDTLTEIIIEAEDGYYAGGFLSYSHPGFQGRGFIDYTNSSEDFLEWKFSTQWSGKHALFFHYANGSTADRPLALSVDNNEVEAELGFPPSGKGQLDWTVWVDTEPVVLSLDTGIHTVRITAIGKSGSNLDYLRVLAPVPYIDSISMNTTVWREGVIDKKVVASLAENMVVESRDADVMNGIEDALTIATIDIKRKSEILLDQNEQLMRQDIAHLQGQLKKTNILNFAAVGIVAILAAIATHLVIGSLKKSIDYPVRLIQRLAQGETDLNVALSNNELDVVIRAGQQLGIQLNKASDFATQIGEGNLQYDFSPSGEKDVLGNALVQMRSKLQEIAWEDWKRNWQTEGLTKFAELLRKDFADRYELSVSIISHLVSYVEVVQGGLFLYDERIEEPDVLVLAGCYAYDRRKYLKKEILLGEGLVGQTFLEAETVYLTEIPDDYVTIRSGLGGSNPKSILLVPLKTDNKVEGVVELASFSEFADYQIEWVERVSEIIASHISAVRMNEQTQVLLKETKEQASLLREQEEELRQNIEEMQATQEQMRRSQLPDEEA